jgi:hypothetical protein
MSLHDFSLVNKKSPPTPSKWDIIPIHTSDRGTFKHCRRQWWLSSPSMRNLIPTAKVHGIREPLWFGTGIHHALEKFYNPTLSEDPILAWLEWFDLQWDGGIITEDQLKEFVDRDPILTEVGVYKVSGLSELMPFADNPETVEHFMHLRQLGEGILKFYMGFAEDNDNFNVISTEHDFSVPILKPNTENVLYMPDSRVMPEGWEPDRSKENKYGPLMRYLNGSDVIEKQVHARGRMDMIIQDTESGRFGILDHKTTKDVPDEDYFKHLELDEQCTTYLWAGELEAKLYDLEYKSLEFITYEAVFKGYPVPPTITKFGMPSINRKTESTTASLYEQTIKVMGIEEVIRRDEKQMAYWTWLLQTGDNKFINRTDTWRNKIQRENAGIRLYYEALDMLNPDTKLYPNPSKNWLCINCIFRGPCIAMETGADYESMLDQGYVSNWDR